ncbi:MAG: TldD/PmbA family protein [Methanobacteriota archaeon]|nr:MAG: TldD/PmbA family protein [Euryarchaeota archaeon]
MSTANPKSIIDVQEYGNPFEKLDEGIAFLMRLAKEKGYEAQITAGYVFSGTTRYAVNQVTQPTEFGEISFSLKLAAGKSVGSGSTTMVNETGLTELFKQVENIVQGAPEIPFFQGLPDPRPGTPKNLGSDDWTVEERAETVIQAINAAEEVQENVIVSGTASTSINYQRIVNTDGIDVETSTNGHYFKVNCIVESDTDKSHRGYGQEEIHFRTNRPNIEEMAVEAAKTAKDTLKLIDLPAKEYEVVLGHQAVSDLFLFAQFSLEPVGFHETNSYASDRIGDQIFDEKINVEDRPLDPSNANVVRAFDGEGLPTSNVQVFEKGVLKMIPYDSFNAARFLGDKNAATGHAFTFFGQTTGMFASFVLEGGNKPYRGLVEDIENGLWVKNFWYNRFTKRREGGLTGLTRNGLYHVENGEIQGAVRNLRYTESFVKAFGPDNVISLSSDRRMYQLNTCPAAHLKAFNFSSVAHTTKQ